MKYRKAPYIIPRNYPDGSIHIPKIENIKEDLENDIERSKESLIKQINKIDDEKTSMYEINEMKFSITWIKKLILLRNKLKRFEEHIKNNEIEKQQITYELYDFEKLTCKPERMDEKTMKKLEKEEDRPKNFASYVSISQHSCSCYLSDSDSDSD